MTRDHLFVGYGVGAAYGGALWAFGAPLPVMPICAALFAAALAAAAAFADRIDL